MWHLLLAVLCSVALASCVANAQTPAAIVTFTFDDVPKSVATVGLPILKKYGYSATVYVETRNTDSNYPGYMNWDDVKAVADAGWEVGAHTYTHPDLTKLSNEEILDDLLTSTQDFARHGYAPVDFASPFGNVNDRVMAILKRHYESHRMAWPSGMNADDFDPYGIASYDVTSATTLDELSSLLESLQKEGGWLVLQVHEVVPKGQPVREQYATNLLEDFVELVHAKGLKVLTIQQALQSLQPKGD